MTPRLGIRVALFLFIHGICYMRGYSRSTGLSQIAQPTTSLVKRLQLSEHKRSSIAPFVFDSSATLRHVQDKEKDSRLNREQSKTDKSEKVPHGRPHQKTMLRSKDSLIFSQSEQAVHPAELRGRTSPSSVTTTSKDTTTLASATASANTSANSIASTAALTVSYLIRSRSQNSSMPAIIPFPLKPFETSRNTAAASNILSLETIPTPKSDTALSTELNATVSIQGARISDTIESAAAFRIAKRLVRNPTILHRMARSVHRRRTDQTDSRSKEPFLSSEGIVAEKHISNLSHEAKELPQTSLSREITEGRVKSQLCRTFKQLLAHTTDFHTSVDDIVFASRQEDQSIPREQRLQETLRLLRNKCASMPQSEEEALKTTVVKNIVRRSAKQNTAAAPLSRPNRISESFINSLVIETINKLIANIYELHETLASMFPGIPIEQNRTELYLDTALASASKEIVAKEVAIKLRTEAKKLKKLRLYLSNMSMGNVKDIVNHQLLSSQVLKNQQSFQNINLPKVEATIKTANGTHSVSGLLRNITRKERHAQFQIEKAPSETAIHEITLKTLADLIAKVFRMYSALSVYLPKISGQIEVNDTNLLSEVTALKNTPKNLVAREALKAIRVAAQKIYKIMERLVLESKLDKSPDVILVFDEKRILAAVLTALRHVLEWVLNLSDIMLDNLKRIETRRSESGVQTTAENTETESAINATAQLFIDLMPKLSNDFKTIIENALHKDELVNKTTLTTSHRSAWKKKRKYDDIYENKRLETRHRLKDNFYKRRSNYFINEFPKEPGYATECQRRILASPGEYGVYHIQTGIMTKKLDPRDLDNPFEFPIEGLENIPRRKNMDVALEFSFKRPLLMSAIGFKKPSDDEHDIVKLATIYVEKQRDRNTWSPLLDEETKNIMLFKVSSKSLHSLPPSHDAWSGIRVYPQQWSSSKPVIGRPIFIYCAFNP